MDDLISRQAAIDALYKMLHDCFWADDEELGAVITTLNDLPSAQPDIIRCKDCRWRKDQSGSTAWLPCRAIATPSEFYCAGAERRTDE